MQRNALVLIILSCVLVITAAASADSFIRDMQFSKDGKSVILTGDDEIRVVSVAEATPQLTVSSVAEMGKFVDYAPESDTIAAKTVDTPTVTLYHTGESEALSRIEFDYNIGNIDFSPDGESILVDSMDEIKARIYDARTGELHKELEGFATAAPVYEVVFSPDGKNILWHSRASFCLQNIADGTMNEMIQVWDFPSAYLLNADSTVLAVSVMDESYEKALIVFYDAKTGEELSRTECGSDPVISMRYTADGALLAADASTFYRLDGDRQLTAKSVVSEGARPGSDDSIRLFAASPDGSYGAFLLIDGEMLIAEINTEN